MKTTVRDAIENSQAPTPPLDDFLADYHDDDNVWWTLSSGHHQNLFDAAVERCGGEPERDDLPAHAVAGMSADSQAIFFASTAQRMIEMMLDKPAKDDHEGARSAGNLIITILRNSGWTIQPPPTDPDSKDQP